MKQIRHPRLVNSAYFSPNSGRKLLTTCIDNRVRIWDNIHNVDRPATQEIVHSHDFNRHLTPFRAEWDPKDPLDRRVVIGRYISEDFDGVALHPVDILDVATGRQIAQLTDRNLLTISPVNKCHPRLDVIVSGSSRALYAWKPVQPVQDDDGIAAASTGGNSDITNFDLMASASFVCFDADDSAAEKKKRKKKGEGNQ